MSATTGFFARKIVEPVKSQNPDGFAKSSIYGAPISAA
jgi:hypothetical protein